MIHFCIQWSEHSIERIEERFPDITLDGIKAEFPYLLVDAIATNAKYDAPFRIRIRNIIYICVRVSDNAVRVVTVANHKSNRNSNAVGRCIKKRKYKRKKREFDCE